MAFLCLCLSVVAWSPLTSCVDCFTRSRNCLSLMIVYSLWGVCIAQLSQEVFHIGYLNATDCVPHHFLVSCSGSSEYNVDDPLLFIVCQGTVALRESAPMSEPTSAAICKTWTSCIYLRAFKNFIHEGFGDGAVGGCSFMGQSSEIISLSWTWVSTGAENLTHCVYLSSFLTPAVHFLLKLIIQAILTTFMICLNLYFGIWCLVFACLKACVFQSRSFPHHNHTIYSSCVGGK